MLEISKFVQFLSFRFRYWSSWKTRRNIWHSWIRNQGIIRWEWIW